MKYKVRAKRIKPGKYELSYGRGGKKVVREAFFNGELWYLDGDSQPGVAMFRNVKDRFAEIAEAEYQQAAPPSPEFEVGETVKGHSTFAACDKDAEHFDGIQPDAIGDRAARFIASWRAGEKATAVDQLAKCRGMVAAGVIARIASDSSMHSGEMESIDRYLRIIAG